MTERSTSVAIHGYGIGSSGPQKPLPWMARPSFATGNLDDWHEHFRERKQSASLLVPQAHGFEGYTESFIKLNKVELSLTSIMSALGYELRFRPREYYCLNVPLNGSGWLLNGSQTVELSAGEGAFVLPSSETLKHWRGPSHVLTIHIPADIFEQELPQINMPSISVIGREGMDALFSLLRPICGSRCDQYSPLLHDTVTQHLEHALLALIAQLLPVPRDDKPKLSPSTAQPYYVRRAERYIRANYHKTVSLGDIALAAGVSPRSLQYGFKLYHGVTPMQFFKRFRLEYARAQLTDTRAAKRLSEIAWSLGYESASQFSRDYREMFGETPSATIAKAPAAPMCQLKRNESVAAEVATRR